MIILGSFFIATAFAFAGDTALNQAKAGFDKSAIGDLPAASGSVSVPAVSAPAAVADPAAATAAAGAGSAVAPAKKATLMEKIKTGISDHKTHIFVGALAAYIGFALVGTVLGACTFGVGAVLVFALATM